MTSTYLNEHMDGVGEGYSSNSGQLAFEADAVDGSHQLRREIEHSFNRFARKHGVTANDARILLMNTGLALQVALDEAAAPALSEHERGEADTLRKVMREGRRA